LPCGQKKSIPTIELHEFPSRRDDAPSDQYLADIYYFDYIMFVCVRIIQVPSGRSTDEKTSVLLIVADEVGDSDLDYFGPDQLEAPHK
jgi:hypothetical protein